MMPKIRAVLELGRISNLPTVMTNVVAAWMLAGGERWATEMFWIVAGSSLLYLGGTTLNDAFDVEFDRKHRPERPIPSAVLSERAVWTIGILDLGLGLGILLIFTHVLLWLALVLVAVILIYDWIHKKSAVGILFMGLCRFFLYIMAASAASPAYFPDLASPVFLWAAALCFYIIGLTFTARGESTGASLLRWPLFLLFLPLGAWSISPGNQFHLVGVAACSLFLAWTFIALRLLRGRSDSRIGRSVSVMLAGIILIDAMAVSTVDVIAAAVLLAVLPVTLAFQRWVAAT